MTTDALYIGPRTGATWTTETALWRAPDDGRYVNLTLGPGIDPGDIDAGEHSLWRYRKALRLDGPPPRILGEGWTPLVSPNGRACRFV